ncbi:family 1 glycosylhydrolase [Nocardia sp. BMG111209]|uniref:family 1 glycosylhydrolase n=1 Tax=Nocardia sp. BMG111209 TaxID=1160137 RepID=UPI0003753D15|nr:family 1 glycosylhydrolase [Nocardia sp. BMG111209]
MRQSKRRRVPAGCAATLIVLTCGLGSATPAAATAPLGDDFLWGVSASGFQSEGDAPDSNWTRYIAGGAAEPYRQSVDFLGNYAADIDRAAGLGAKVYRISIEWARVQPDPAGWDEPALRTYEQIVDRIIAAGMKPMLTLDHWVYPGWAADRGGWRNPAMVADWLRNAQQVVHRFAGRDPLWVTINEPAAYVGTELRIGAITPDEAPVVTDRLAQAHNAIYDTIHLLQPTARVTSNLGYVPAAETEVNQPYVDKIAAKLDFLGVDYYFGPTAETALAGTDAGAPRMWELPEQTEGIYYALRHYARQFPGKPLYVVENGIPTENGRPRPDGYTRADHLRDTIYWLQRARADGLNIIGYNYWSLTDNYEWGSYTPRFGLYTVDVDTDPTLTRHPTDAVTTYATLTRDGGVPADYHPTRPPVPCSLVDPPTSCDDPVHIP